MEIKRAFDGTDAYLIETAITIRSLMQNDLADFSPFSTKFDATYLAAFQTAIDDCLAFGTDETAQDQQSQLTNDVLAALKNCFKKYGQMKFFAEQAFPKNIDRQNEFGTNDYQKARRNQAQMIVFMDTLHAISQKYKTDLIAAGATQAQIDEILTLRDAYIEANRKQEVAIKERPSDTRERNIKLNTLYGFIVTVNSAAQIIYYDNDAKKGAYVFNPGVSSGKTIKEGSAAPNATIPVAEVPYRANRNITFENTGAEQLFFGLGTTPNAIEGTVVGVPAGESNTLRSEELLAEGNFIICKNDSPNPSSYKVEYDN